VGQLLGLEVSGVIVKPSMLQSTVGIAANITLGRVFGKIQLSSLSAEGPSGAAHTSKENVTSFIVMGTKATGVPKAASAETGTCTPGVGTTTMACAATSTTAGIAVAMPRAAPVATTTPTNGGGSSCGGGMFSPLARSVLSSFGRRREESWVVDPKLVIINALLNFFDNVIERAKRLGEICHIDLDN
jgi:hypothetical protein